MNVSRWHMVCDGIEKFLSEELHGKLGVVVERIPRTQPVAHVRCMSAWALSFPCSPVIAGRSGIPS